MDFTNAYNNITNIVNGESQYLSYKFNYNNALIKTYICNEFENNENNITVFLIISTDNSESLKSISVFPIGNEYYFKGLWPRQSFFDVYDTIKTKYETVEDGKTVEKYEITSFLSYWVERLESISISDLNNEDKNNIQTKIRNVSSENSKRAKRKEDIEKYPFYTKHSNRTKNGVNNIGTNKEKLIRKTFGEKILNGLKKRQLTVNFTPDPLKQKSLNLIDLIRD